MSGTLIPLAGETEGAAGQAPRQAAAHQGDPGGRGVARLALAGFVLAIVVVALLAPIATNVVRDLIEKEREISSGYVAMHKFNDIKSGRAKVEQFYREYLYSGQPQLAADLEQAVAGINEDWMDVRDEYRKVNQDAAANLEFTLAADNAFMREVIDVRRSKGVDAAQRYAQLAKGESLDMQVLGLLSLLETGQMIQIQRLQASRDASTYAALKSASFLVIVLLGGLGWLYLLIRGAERRRLQAADSLRESEERFRSLIELSADWYWEQDDQQRFTFLSSEAGSKSVNLGVTTIGLKREELSGIDLASADWAALDEICRKRLPYRDFVYRRFATDGVAHWVRISGEPLFDGSKRFRGYRGVATDVTLQRQSEQEITRHKDLYAALSHTNRAIIHIHDPQQLFDEVCRVAVEYGHFCLAWIGLVEKDGWIVPKAIQGPVSEVYRRMRVSTNADLPEGRGFAGAAVRDNRPYIVNDFLAEPRVAPWKEQARVAGVRSLATFPLRCDGQCVGVLNLHGDEINFFSDELVAMLEEMAGNISFALTNLKREAEREADKRALDASEKKFRHLAANVPEIFWTADPQTGQITYVSPAYELIFGRSVDNGVKYPPEWVEAIHPEDVDQVKSARKRAMSANVEEEFRIVRPDGEVRWLQSRSFPVSDADGRVTLITGVAEDITSRKFDEEKLQHLAQYDSLTELPNRSLFYDRLQQTILHSRREGRLAAVVFVDVDHFKHINDTMGHAAGDRLLQHVAHRLQEAVRDGDTVGRLGGDEFAIILSNLAAANDAGIVAQKLLSSLNEPFELEGRELFVTASVGVTLFPDDGEVPDTLIRNADVAMYRAKELGRNTYQFFKAEMNARALERMSMESHLRRALERKEFQLHYQPKVDLASGEITGLEALLRWRHPDLGLVPPSRFIPILEDNGLIIQVGEWVLEEVCRQLKRWGADDNIPVVPVAVNISGRQLQQKDIGRKLQRITSESGIAPRLLEFEITESVLMKDPEKTSVMLRTLQQLGFRLSVDDFGTGYSSLNYLKSFPLDTLKIDRSFIKDIATEPDDAMITRAIISMAHSLRLKVVAEGVETAAQQALLAAAGCDEMQGFFFSTPLAEPECAALLRERRRLSILTRGVAGEATLLIVDDDPAALELTCTVLRDEGYRILTAQSGDLALELLATNDVNVVMSDQRMPGMSGVELLRRVRGLYPEVVRIVVSADVDAATATQAVNQGAVFKVLTKSPDAEQLRISLREAFAQCRRRPRGRVRSISTASM